MSQSRSGMVGGQVWPEPLQQQNRREEQQNPETKRRPENVWFRRLKGAKMAIRSSRSKKVKRIFQQFNANHGTAAWAVLSRRSRGPLHGRSSPTTGSSLTAHGRSSTTWRFSSRGSRQSK
jgi:hypothetical protein